MRIWRPLQALTEAMKRLPGEAQQLSVRVASTDEVGELGRAFKAMAAQVAESRASLEGRVAELAALQKAGAAVTSSLQLPGVLEAVADSAIGLIGAERCAVFELDPNDQHLDARASRGMRADQPFMPIKLGQGAAGSAALLRRVVFSPDVHREPLPMYDEEWEATGKTLREVVRQRGYRAVLAVPLVSKETVVGAICIYWDEVHSYDQGEVRLLTALAQQAAVAIENARLHEESRARAQALRERNTQVQHLHEATRALTAEHDVEQLLQRIVETARELLGAGYGALAVFQHEGRIGQFFTAGLTPEARERIGPLPEGRGLLGHVFKHGQTLRMDDLATHPVAAGFPPGHPPMRSLLAMPIRFREEILGALYLTEKPGGFTVEDEALLTTLCADAALAVVNARLLAEERQRRREGHTLLEIAHAASSTLELTPLLKEVCQRTAQTVGMDRCSIFLWDEGRVQAVMSQFADGHADSELWRAFRSGERFRMEQFPAFAEAIRLARPVLVEDAAGSDLVPRWWVETFDLKTVLVVPLIRQDAAIGVLHLDNTTERRSVTEDQIRLAMTIGSQVALAVDNARLVQNLRKAMEDLKAAQEQLVRGETLRAVGELASGTAHHLNNILAVIGGRIELLLQAIQEPSLRRSLEIAAQAVKKGADVVRRVREFSRARPVSKAGPVDLNQLAQEALELTRPRWQGHAQAKGISIEARPEPGQTPAVLGDPVLLTEVLVNVLLNAVDALPNGGRITVKTWASQERVHCSVTDTGVGMSEEVRRRALDPFFTTKGPKSAGLGLSVAHGILQRHGGELAIESVEGKGTMVTISLPVSPATVVAQPAPATPSAPMRRAKILVIDDEAEVREILADLLAGQGHRVSQAASGAEGVVLFQRAAMTSFSRTSACRG